MVNWERNLAGPHCLACVLPRGIEVGEDKVSGGAHDGDVEGGGYGGGRGREKIEWGGKAIEDWW